MSATNAGVLRGADGARRTVVVGAVDDPGLGDGTSAAVPATGGGTDGPAGAPHPAASTSASPTDARRAPRPRNAEPPVETILALGR
ncbi:hypothetical protein RHODO2019_01615 [Rhodococcus antarcticus]|uniref:Uncharacterized protein n=1 Tax=Rhodococcus antarcticus TaxID=2987751 RepID=A0ABY6P250_9NOCA|nr:hypothetical protein [Rhodococcus antarcticus]UZJ25223.1 hypothetical protein RHODO2019_01615 [Rhodococcus antarcticus]